ncbi:MAG: SirB1 family protein [Lysobacteraceae bacterium]
MNFSSITQDAWNQLARLPDGHVDLFDGALLVARDEYPELDVAHYRALIDEHERALHSRLPSDADVQARLIAVNRYLFDELGFTGNQDAFYDPRNSYINDVLERRLGIPLSLGLVQMELARRMGVPLEGVSFPGHFLVRLPVEGGLLVLDPYHRGRSIDAEELKQRARPHLNDIDIDDAQLMEILEPASHRSILTRMLRNLKALYAEQEVWDKALRSADRLVQLVPGQPGELRDRGELYLRIGHIAAARRDLGRYLELAPDAFDAERIHEMLIDAGGAAPRFH